MRCPECAQGELRPLTDRATGTAACVAGKCAARCESCGHSAIVHDPAAVRARHRRVRVVTLSVTVLGVGTELAWNFLLPWILRDQHLEIRRFAVHAVFGTCVLGLVYGAMRYVLEAMTAETFQERNQNAFLAAFCFLALGALGWLIVRMISEGRL